MTASRHGRRSRAARIVAVMRAALGLVGFSALVLVVACSAGPAAAPAAQTPAAQTPADAFLAAIRQHCGQAFAGRIVANDPATPDDPFVGKTLVMHVRECAPAHVSIPFHVGDDRSRTWVLTRTASGLRLKHDHRHADGSSDVLTMYGGDSAGAGAGGTTRQEFPVDAESKALFTREKREASLTNVWAIEVEPGRRFVYELARPGRLFRVAFDLTAPVEAPPAPWGH